MSPSTTIHDTNVVSSIEALPSVEREAVLEALQGVPLVTSMEIIEEILAVAEKRDHEQLEVRARFLLSATRVPPFREYPDVVRGELRGHPPPQIPREKNEQFRSALMGLLDGTAPLRRLRPLAGEIREEKQSDLSKNRQIREEFRAKAREVGCRTQPTSFEDLHQRYWQKNAGTMDGILGLGDTGVSFAAALQQPDRYPFTRALARVQTALLYRHLVEDRKPDKGDVRDGGMLVHLVAADILVTEDRGLREMAGHVWGTERKVLTFAEHRAGLLV